MKLCVKILLCLALITSCNTKQVENLTFTEVCELPALKVGESQMECLDDSIPNIGVAGAFVGAIKDKLVIAGGSNFPNGPKWEGGEKTFHNEVYVMEKVGEKYKCKVSSVSLPFSVAHGASAVVNDTMYCFGGQNSKGFSNRVFSISNGLDSLNIQELRSLPEGFVTVACAVIKNLIFIEGYKDNRNELLSYNVETQEFKSLASCPGNTIHFGAVFVPIKNKIYLIGGRAEVDSQISEMFTNYWEYNVENNAWTNLGDVIIDGEKRVLMASSAVAYGKNQILIIGGDDGKKQGFSKEVLSYTPSKKEWKILARFNNPLPAVSSASFLGDYIFMPCGEISPCVRSNKILRFSIK